MATLADYKDDKAHPIVLAGGKTYLLRFTFNAVCELQTIEQELGVGRAGDEGPALNLKHTRAMLWAGLREHHGKEVVTLEDAGNLIPLEDFVRISSEVNRAFIASLPGLGGGPPSDETPTGEPSSIGVAASSGKSFSGGVPPAE